MSGSLRQDVRELSLEDIGRFLKMHNEKVFRASQVYDWLWKNACRSFESMSNLSKSTRELLTENFSFHTAIAEVEQKSLDGTVKTGFRLHDGLMVEGVLIPAEERFTACISSQVGCALGCTFCATGTLGFSRNLTCGEIFDQVTYFRKLASQQLSNIVFMGMGEPYLNYDNLVKSIEKITSPEGLAMSPQRITISSIGIPKMIRKMGDDDPKYHFALSLHAATDLKRNKIIPFNQTHPLPEIIDALKYYHTKTGKRFTIEYILFGNFNDSLEDARDLARFCKNFPVKINIIEFNTVKTSDLFKSNPVKTKAFVDFLEGKNLVVNVRKSRGRDIDAACGQLIVDQSTK